MKIILGGIVYIVIGAIIAGIVHQRKWESVKYYDIDDIGIMLFWPVVGAVWMMFAAIETLMDLGRAIGRAMWRNEN